MKRIIVLATIAAIVVVIVVIAAMQRQSPTEQINKTVSGQRLVVAATIFPVVDMVRNVAGHDADVIQIVPPGASEHTFELTPDIVLRATRARAVFKIGIGLDDWAQTVANAGQNVAIIDLSTVFASSTDDRLALYNNDPHYWLTCAGAKLMVDAIEHELSRLDPANTQTYAANASRYRDELAREDAFIKQRLATAQRKQIATFHEAWGYYANWYGLDVVATFEPSPGNEPTPKYVADFIKAVRDKHVRVIFSEPQLSNASIAQVAHDLGVRLDTLDPVGGTPPQTNSYIKLMRYNTEQIVQALQ